MSRIYLDRETSALQSKVLSRIMGEFLGKQRLPMIILDTSAVVKNRAMFSARGAGILGFSMFARDRVFALDEHMELDREGLEAFLEKHGGEDIFLFGFTFMIWQHFVARLRETGYHPDLSRGVLVHGGGWKKLADQQISTERFKRELRETCGLTRVHNYYGMVEQTGTIYMECRARPPARARVVGRDHPAGRGLLRGRCGRDGADSGIQRAAAQLSGPCAPHRGRGAHPRRGRLPLRPQGQVL